MKKYIITDKVNSKAFLPENVLLRGAVAIAQMNPINGLVPIVAIIAAKAMHDKSITKITSEEELKKYKNCIAKEWKKNIIYVEHPFRQNALIEASFYKNYILRELVSDISNYIMDHWDLSKLVIGLVVSGKRDAKIKIPVKDIDADAQIQCDLHKRAVRRVDNVNKSLSYYAAKSNGIIEDAESDMIQEYCREMDLAPFTAGNEISMDDIHDIFDGSTESNKRIIILEIMGLMYADGDFDDAEREFVNGLVQSFGLETVLVESLEKVIIKYLDVVNEVKALVF